MRFPSALVAAALAVTPAAMAQDASQPAASADLVDTAVAAGSFSTLVSLVQTAGLEETLRGEGPFTVFAPTDEAFAAVPADTLAALGASPEALSDVLLYHVVPGRVLAADAAGLDRATTAQGQAITITHEGGGVQVNGANVVTADVAARNGVIHVIDQVILPPGE